MPLALRIRKTRKGIVICRAITGCIDEGAAEYAAAAAAAAAAAPRNHGDDDGAAGG